MTAGRKGAGANGQARVVRVLIVRVEPESVLEKKVVRYGSVVTIEVEIFSTHSVECAIELEPEDAFNLETGKVSEDIGPLVNPVRRVWALRARTPGRASISVRAGTQLSMLSLTIEDQ